MTDRITAFPLRSERLLTIAIAVLVLMKLLLPFLLNGDWGFHRDEFLYLAMGDHLAWGYLEVPPVIAVLGAVADALFGSHVALIRLFPALAGAATMVLIVAMTIRMGGGRYAQVLAVLGYLVAIVNLRINVLFQPVAFDMLAWVAAVYGFMVAIRENRARDWILLGLVVGIGLLTKYTMLLFAGGAVLALLLTPHRRLLGTPWPWVAALIAVAVWSPNLYWQLREGWPVVEHMTVLAERQLQHVDPMIFLLVQILMNPWGAPLWLLGLWWCLTRPEGRPWRPLAWIYLANLAVLLLLSGKVYYLAPAYPMLLAAGATALEGIFRARAARRIAMAVPLVMLAGSAPLVPLALPLLPVEDTIAYGRFGTEHLGFGEALRWEDGTVRELPQDFADMLGWEELVAATADVFRSLPPGQQAHCGLYADNYGQAGAFDRYGERYGLPPVISKGSSYWLWGYRGYDGDPLIIVGLEAALIDNNFDRIVEVRRYRHPFARETDLPILVVGEPTQSMAALWAILKKYRY